MAILRRLPEFRGDSRFTTWAYKFAILEVSSKLGRHFWVTRADVPLDTEQWERLPARFGLSPESALEAADLLAGVRTAVDGSLSQRQRDIFVALVVDGVPLDALAQTLTTDRNTIYKVMFDARRKIRAALVTKGYLDSRSTMSDDARAHRVLGTDDDGLRADDRVLHAYVDSSSTADPAVEYPGIAATGACRRTVLLTVRGTGPR